jgi:hypothetical protein
MIAGIPQFQSAPNFCMKEMWIFFFSCLLQCNIAFILFQTVIVPEEADFASQQVSSAERKLDTRS